MDATPGRLACLFITKQGCPVEGHGVLRRSLPRHREGDPLCLYEVLPMATLRIAFLHLAPCLRDLQANRRLIDRAVTTAATSGATWILTPELCLCGYDFTDDLGTAWIVPPPDPWMTSLCQRAASFGVTVFLSHPERDAQSGKCYNTLFV